MRVYVIGHEDAVLGFALAGVEGFATNDPEEAARELDRVMHEPRVGIVLVTAGIASKLRARLNELQAQETGPIVLEVPAPGEALEQPSVRDMVRQAVGVRI